MTSRTAALEVIDYTLTDMGEKDMTFFLYFRFGFSV
jgi:hypothetical protein